MSTEKAQCIVLAIVLGIVVLFGVLFIGTSSKGDEKSKDNESAYNQCIALENSDSGYSIYLDGQLQDNSTFSIASLNEDNYEFEIDYKNKSININKIQVRKSRNTTTLLPIFMH